MFFLHPEVSTLKGAFGASTFDAKQSVCKVNFVQACPYWGKHAGGLYQGVHGTTRTRTSDIGSGPMIGMPPSAGEGRGRGGARSESRLRGQAQSNRTPSGMAGSSRAEFSKAALIPRGRNSDLGDPPSGLS